MNVYGNLHTWSVVIRCSPVTPWTQVPGPGGDQSASINPNVSAVWWGNIILCPHTQVPSQRLGECSIRCYTVIFAWKSLIFRLATRQHQCNVECKLRGLVMICVDSLGTAQPSTANMQTRHRPASLLMVTTDNWAQSRTFLRAPDCVGLEVSGGRSLSCCYRSKH